VTAVAEGVTPGTEGRPTNLLDRVNHGLTLVAAGLTALFFVLICAQVVCRYALAYSISWSEEVSRYAFIWATFVGACAVAGRGEHYEVTILDDVVPRVVRVILIALRKLVEGGFAFIVLYAGIAWVTRQWGVSTPVVEANQGIVYTIVPAFGAYVLLQVARSTLAVVRGRHTKDS
jgi:TRAP-type C4-dicarboxylate transport system permease small subunit